MKYTRKILTMLLLMIVLVCLPITANAAVRMNKKSISINTRKTYQLKISGANGKISWSSSNKKVAKVTSKGLVTALKKGTCRITAKAGKKKISCKVTVKQPVTSIKISKKTLTLKKGKKYTLKASVAPANANNKKLAWKSNNKKIATVSAKGVITAKASGTAIITVYAKDGSGKKVTCKVTVPGASKSNANNSIIEESHSVTPITSYVVSKNYLDLDRDNRRYFAYTEITNTGNTNLYMDNAVFEFYDNYGNLIDRDSSSVYCTHKILGPGQKAYYYNGFGYHSVAQSVNLNNGFVFKPVVKVKRATGITDVYHASETRMMVDSIGWPALIGKISNGTNKDAGYVYLVAILYDANDNVLAISGTSIIDLYANSTISFKDSFMGFYGRLDPAKVAKCQVVAQRTYYQFN